VGSLLAPERTTAFDPVGDGLVIVNISAPARVHQDARIRLDSAVMWSNGQASVGELEFDELQASRLAGRAPRWARFVVSEGIVDSLVLHWSGFETRIDEAWIQPSEARATVIPLHRRIDRAEAIVLNLRWNVDASEPDDEAWVPLLELEDLLEPPVGGRVYVSEEGEGIVSVFDRVTGRMVRAIPVGGAPRDLAWDEVLQRLYVVVAGRDELAVIDVAGRETLRRVPLSFGAEPTRVWLTRDRQRVAVVAPGRDLVFLYSAGSLQEIAKVRVGQEPVAIVEDRGGGRLFVSCRKAGEIAVVDPAIGRVISRFEGFESPTELAMLESGLLAVGQDRVSRVDLVDPNSGASLSSLQTCGATRALLSVGRFDRLYVVDRMCSEISIFRPESGLEIGAFPLKHDVGLPNLDPRESVLLLPVPETRRVVLLAIDSGEELLSCDVGPGPWRVIAP
jgi:YVTN family beta-propeller protein